MVVHFWIAIYVVGPRNRKLCPDVAVEFASAGDIRDKDDFILAGSRLVDTVEDPIWWSSRETQTILRTPAALGTLEEVA